MTQATERFSSRVENYIRYRPNYPQGIIKCLRTHCGLTDASVVADVGSGTGILTGMFLQNGNSVYGLEPNREMRLAGERLLQAYHRFKSVAGTAEETTLAPSSIDFVTAGQAFHWFDQDKTKAEFQRILKPQGWVVFVWNERRETSTSFGQEYESLLQGYSTDYQQVNHKRIDDKVLHRFFGHGFQLNTFENSQHFDFEGLRGRLLSSSYAPEAGHPLHAPMLLELQRIFNEHQDNGKVTIEYDTNLYYGHLG